MCFRIFSIKKGEAEQKIYSFCWMQRQNDINFYQIVLEKRKEEKLFNELSFRLFFSFLSRSHLVPVACSHCMVCSMHTLTHTHTTNFSFSLALSIANVLFSCSPHLIVTVEKIVCILLSHYVHLFSFTPSLHHHLNVISVSVHRISLFAHIFLFLSSASLRWIFSSFFHSFLFPFNVNTFTLSQCV